jgi:hypothetical protein
MATLPRRGLRIRPLIVLFAAAASVAAQQESAPAPAPQGQAAPPTRAQGGGAPPSDDAFRYGSPPALPAGTSQEQMWPAATAEGWAKPCLIPWQRTFDDALEVSKATGAPILVCVNMDGEIASEHFAGVRYRDPATAKALERYVCVVASVYRHTPRDYDEQGRRVICPRFGTVTCGEHIANEVELYGKYFEGKRISPRHIMLDLDGRKSYDVYYSWDTQTVFTAFAKGVENLPPPRELLHDGLTPPDLVASAHVADRVAVERAYQEGDHETRVAILRGVIANRAARQDDVLRLAVFGLDLECARLARQALAQSESEGSIDVIAEALKVPLDPEQREALVAAAERLGATYPQARVLAALHQGLAMESTRFGTSDDLGSGPSVAEYVASAQAHADSAAERPQDPAAKLALAESLLACAFEAGRDLRWRRAALEDARTNAEEAAALGASGWRLDATLCAVLAELGETEPARAHAVAAVEGGMESAPTTRAGTEAGPPELAKVRVLALFAQARQQSIRKAYREKSPWPPEWLADIDGAYARLAAHDLATEENLVSYYDFLAWLGGAQRASAVLEDALARFPDSALLHERLRSRVLWEKGPEELESEYARRLSAESPSTQLTWYAGYASLVAAEHFRRANRLDRALEAYEHGIAYYERNIAEAPEGRDVCDHFIALAHAGRARVLLERGELEGATADLLAAFERRAASTGTMDGLDITPGMTALMLKSRLAEARAPELSAKLAAAMDAMDPQLFAEPDFARQGQSDRGTRVRGARGDRGG